MIGPRLGKGVGGAAALRPSNASRAVVCRRGWGAAALLPPKLPFAVSFEAVVV